MVDKDKIIALSQLAVYDKNNGNKDREVDKYFRHDYVYIKNFKTRFFACLGASFFILLRFLHKITVNNIDLLTVDFKAEGIEALIILAVVMVAYTVIGTVSANMEYTRATRRLSRYYKLMKAIEDRDAARQKAKETEEDSYYGADSSY